MTQKRNFLPGEAVIRVLVTLSVPPPAEATSTSFKSTVIKKKKKKSGKGEKSDFDLGNPEGERKGKEVR